MWALCPPSYHDNDMPIDLRKKVVLERELDERREYYRGSEDVDSPRDYSFKDSSRDRDYSLKDSSRDRDYSLRDSSKDRDYSLRDSSRDRDYSLKDSSRDKWQQSNVSPVTNLYPFVSEQYGGRCSVVAEDREKPQDLRSPNRGTLESAIKKLHNSSKLKQTLDSEKEQRCKSTDALLEKENIIKRPNRSSSCPGLLGIIEQKPLSNLPVSTPSSNCSVSSEIKNYSEYNEYSPEHESIPSPIIGGARKRKSFVPLYGDRAPVYERYRSPSPQLRVVCNESYRSPSPKRPLYIHNGYHSPSPEHRIYSERIYRSPSPKRPIYSERRYYSPSPTRPIYDERSYHSPSPNRPIYAERSFRSPSPKRMPKSPTEHPPYEEYFSHPEVLLRRQLGHQNASPYFLHVYDYYQHLVQRLREQSSPTVRINSPISPTPIEDDTHPDAQRKRPCRALTGKHVRQGTGASLSTLLTLRQKIQERQKAKEHQPRTALNGINKNGSVKRSTPKKVKMATKSPLGKIQNC